MRKRLNSTKPKKPNGKYIYKIICKVASYTYIICMLNKIKYGRIDQNLNVQENLDFSKEHKENLEFHLKRFE